MYLVENVKIPLSGGLVDYSSLLKQVGLDGGTDYMLAPGVEGKYFTLNVDISMINLDPKGDGPHFGRSESSGQVQET